MKKVLLGVQCINEAIKDTPKLFVCEIHPEIKEAIVKAVDFISLNDFYSVKILNTSGEWSNDNIDECDIENEQIEGLILSLSQTGEEMKDCFIEVFSTHFCWTAIPKYLDDDGRVMSKKVPLSFLSSNDNTVVLIESGSF